MNLQALFDDYLKVFGKESFAPLAALMLARSSDDAEEILELTSKTLDRQIFQLPDTEAWLQFYRDPISAIEEIAKLLGIDAAMSCEWKELLDTFDGGGRRFGRRPLDWKKMAISRWLKTRAGIE